MIKLFIIATLERLLRWLDPNNPRLLIWSLYGIDKTETKLEIDFSEDKPEGE